MQFKENAKTLSCIRNIYDPAKGRGIQQTIATIPRWSNSIHTASVTDLITDLTDDEKAELQAYLDKREAEAKDNDLKGSFSSAAYRMKTVIEALDAGYDVSEKDARRLYESMDLIAKGLKKQGFKKGEMLKPKPKPKEFELEQERDGE